MVKRQDYKKTVGLGNGSSLSIAKGLALHSKPSDPTRQSINTYAKNTPADASGKGQIGYNLFSMGRKK